MYLDKGYMTDSNIPTKKKHMTLPHFQKQIRNLQDSVHQNSTFRFNNPSGKSA